LPRINAAIQRAGATQVLQRQPKPVAHVLDACCRIFSLPPIPDPDSDSYDPDPEWLEHASLLSAESLNQMTRTLPALLVEEQDPHELHQLLAGIHAFADRTQFLNTPAVYQTSIALAQLIDDLVDMPEQMNASILRTIGQAVDFMGRLARDSGSVSVRPPTECSILIVDDEETARQFIQAAMQTVGVHSHLSGHPHDALKFLESNQVDSIFLDIGMPDMSGFDLCTQIRNLPNHKATPVIFITGLTTFQNRVQSSLSGGNDFIGKPFNLAELGLKALISVVRGQIDASTS
jgi:CheY-like chemotaxis protein